ncbi:hypothetical protein B9Z65_8079 [Elsinoe australis]|uniref:Uncharacterized protein n=1 Tax=Elsinoe australis TaxID=40998 RepID=A0A2P7YW01_9PEZI|nr:hypothetical protein B9Z65_8079 [Elsinoe australis]
MPKRKRNEQKSAEHRKASPAAEDPDLDSEDEDGTGNVTIRSSLNGEKVVAQYKKAKTTHAHTITFESKGSFSMTPMTLTEGLFKGQQAILLLPETKPDKGPSLLDLPPEVRNLIYTELFAGSDDHVHVSKNRRNSKVRSYMRVPIPVKIGSGHTSIVEPFTRIAIFRANRQVHAETTALFYGTKIFSAPTTSSMVNFLHEMGPATALIRNLEVTEPKRTSIGQFCKLVKGLPNLQSLSLNSRDWVLRQHSEYSVWGYHSWTMTVKELHAHFMPFLHNVQKSQQDIQKVSRVIKFINVSNNCPCQGYDTENKRSKCRKSKEEMDGMTESFRLLIVQSLEEAEDALKEAAERESEKTKMVVEDLDDFSYLDPAPAPERRDTGRPKRRAVAEKR